MILMHHHVIISKMLQNNQQKKKHRSNPRKSINLQEEYIRAELASVLPRNPQPPQDNLSHHKAHVSQNEYAIQSMRLRSPTCRQRSQCLYMKQTQIKKEPIKSRESNKQQIYMSSQPHRILKCTCVSRNAESGWRASSYRIRNYINSLYFYFILFIIICNQTNN